MAGGGCRRGQRPLLAVTLVLAAWSGAAAQPPGLPDDSARASLLLRQAEAARAGTEAQRAVLKAGLSATNVALRMQALRAVGRLEDPAWLDALASLLDDPSIEARAEAAWAIAQAASTSDAAEAAASRLRTRLAAEPDNMVRAALVTALGRLPYASARAAEAAAATLDAQIDAGGASSMRSLGVVRGAHALARTCARQRWPCAPVASLLDRLVRDFQPDRSTAPAVAVRVRRVAALGLHALGAIDDAAIDLLLDDEDDQVRRLGALAAAADPSTSDSRAASLARDPAPLVRQAFLAHGGQRWPELARAALHDANGHVRLAAIDALGAAGACGCDAWLGGEAEASARWHEYAHALVATARSNPAAAARPLERAQASPTWQVRMYAARAAEALGDVPRLRALARDPHPNVRAAALTGLDALGHRQSDDLRREALDSGDYQLVLTAARGLEGTEDHAAARPALLGALRRITDERRDTSRDPRLAILERLHEVGDEATRAALAPWRDDDDPVVAAAATAVLGGRDVPAVSATAPAPMTLPVPSPEEIAADEGTLVVLSLAGLGDVVISPWLAEAPMNALRFIQQVERGAWDGLTFHRVEPGFVVQGGSVGANEYAGADRYTRDERGPLSHVRGTVGISTRGRDTGDGQIFVNLVDNPRLDNAYTIIGTIVEGLSLIDGIHEGAVIERARLTRR